MKQVLVYTNGQFYVVEVVLSDRSKVYNIGAHNGRGGERITLDESCVSENEAVRKVDALAAVLS